MAVPLGRNGGWESILRGLTYNLGRIITYALLGLIVGLLGQRLALGGYQQILSIAVGLLILLGVVIPRHYSKKIDPTSFVTIMLMKAKSLFGKALKSRSLVGPLGLGIMNGLLPCGTVYIGLAGALVLGGAVESAIFMAAFGLGTLPMMLAIHLAGSLISINVRTRIRTILPYSFAVLGVLFILRGMGLGIPFVSPSIDMKTGGVEQCHLVK